MKFVIILCSVTLTSSVLALSLVSEGGKIVADIDKDEIKSMTYELNEYHALGSDLEAYDFVFVHEPTKILSICKHHAYDFCKSYGFMPWHTVYRRSRGPPKMEKVTN